MLNRFKNTGRNLMLAAAATPLGDTGSSFTYQNLVNLANNLVLILLQVAEVGAVGAIVYYGVRMALAGSDAAAFSNARKGVLWSLVGALIIFGVYTIVRTVAGAVGSIGS